MKSVICALLLVPALATADSTKTVLSVSGKCAVTVPAAWKGDKSIATSPDKKVSILVSQPKMIDSFDELKTSAKQIYQNARVTKDSATEFEFEGKAMNGKPNVYRAIPAGDKVFCLAEVQYESGTVDDARKLVHTLAAK
jgi:hypothetical protein